MNALIDWNVVDFGKRPDAELARELGIGRMAVTRQRRLGNIPAWQHQNKPPKHDFDSLGLGNEPDDAISLRSGINRKTIAFERQRRGIAPFGGYVLTQEGLPCRSLPEAMYDAYLHWKQISHDHEVPVLKYRADFKVGDEYHEVAGLMGHRRLEDVDGSRFDYGKKLQKKLANLHEAGFEVVVLTVPEIESLYKGCPLRLKFRTDHSCSTCRESCDDYLMKGLCQKCYMKQWHDRNAIHHLVCQSCHKPFPSSNADAKYCSTECYHVSHSFQWPELDHLERMVASKTQAAVARELGVKPGTLAVHLGRARKLKNKAGTDTRHAEDIGITTLDSSYANRLR